MTGGSKRKRGALIWARDGDREGAAEHPAHLLDGGEEGVGDADGNDGDAVWIEWASTGAVVRIPRGRISSSLASRRSRTAGARGRAAIDSGTPPVAAAAARRSNGADGSHGPAQKRTRSIITAPKHQEGEFDHDTDGEEVDSGAPRPSPIHSAAVKTEEVYDADTDAEEDNANSQSAFAVPSPVASATVKREDEYGYETDDGVNEAPVRPQWTHSDFMSRLCEYTEDDEPSKGKKDRLNLRRSQACWIHCGGMGTEKRLVWEGMGRCDEYWRWHEEDFVWWVDDARGVLRLLPKKCYTFWSGLFECRTWGEVRARYARGFYQLLMQIQAERISFDTSELEGKRILDDEAFNLKLLNPSKHQAGKHDTFPPCIEQIQLVALGDSWLRRHGRLDDGCLYFAVESKVSILQEIDEEEYHPCKMEYKPGMARFHSMLPLGGVESYGRELYEGSGVGSDVFKSLVDGNDANEDNNIGNKDLLRKENSWIASRVSKYSREEWRRGEYLRPKKEEQMLSVTTMPANIIGEIIAYLAIDVSHAPALRALQCTCRSFKSFFYGDYTWEMLYPRHLMIPDGTTAQDGGEKLNLWKGEIRNMHIKNLENWSDMKEGRDEVDEFVWWVDERGSHPTQMKWMKFVCLPKKTFAFWSKLQECKTWGDLRANYTAGFCRAVMNMYRLNWAAADGYKYCDNSYLLEGRQFLDEKKFDLEHIIGGDYVEIPDEDYFPPFIEKMQLSSLSLHCQELLRPFGEWVMDFFGDEHLYFEATEKDAILASIKAQGYNVQYEPGFVQFPSFYTTT